MFFNIIKTTLITSIIIIISSILTSLQLIQCDIQLPGEITENTLLQQAFSPYIANQDLIIRKNAKLTIEPGYLLLLFSFFLWTFIAIKMTN
jgi:hypothetical protein